jgi:hypothetical protein
MAAPPRKYLDLFDGAPRNTRSFAPAVGDVTRRVERYGNSPLFATGVIESDEAFALRTLTLAYLWPQFFVPFMVMQDTQQAVSAVALHVPPLVMGFSHPRVTFARSLAGNAAWTACFDAADAFVTNYYNAVVPVANAAGLTADDPVVRAVGAVLRDFHRVYDAQRTRMAVIGLATMYRNGISDMQQVTRQADVDVMVQHMRQFDGTEFYGRVGNTFATAVSALSEQFDRERLTVDDIDAARAALATYLGQRGVDFADVEYVNAAGLAALRTLPIPSLPRRLPPVADDTAAQRMIMFVHKLARISYFNYIGVENKRAGLYNTTFQALATSPDSAERDQLLALITAEQTKPVLGKTHGIAKPAARRVRARPGAARAKPAARRAAVEVVDIDDDDDRPAPDPKRRVPTDEDELPGGAGLDDVPASSSSSAYAAAEAARMAHLSPLVVVVGTPAAQAPADEILPSLFRSAAPDGAADDDPDAPPLLDPAALEAAIENYAISYGLEPRGLQTTPHVSSPAQTPSAARPITDEDLAGDIDEEMAGVFDVDGFWVLLSLLALRGHPFGMLGYDADRWVDIVIGWHARAMQATFDSFAAPPPTREFWQRAGVGAMLADTERAHLHDFVEHVLRLRPEFVDRMAAVLAATTEGVDAGDVRSPSGIAVRNGLTMVPGTPNVDAMRDVAAHSYETARIAAARSLETMINLYIPMSDPLAGADYWTARAAPSPLSSSSSSLRPVTPASPASSPTPAPALYNTRDAAQSLLDYARATLGASLPALARIGLEHGRITGRPASNWLASSAQ